jgi:hypothetical protein
MFLFVPMQYLSVNGVVPAGVAVRLAAGDKRGTTNTEEKGEISIHPQHLT